MELYLILFLFFRGPVCLSFQARFRSDTGSQEIRLERTSTPGTMRNGGETSRKYLLKLVRPGA
jgi:hypothetical protein